MNILPQIFNDKYATDIPLVYSARALHHTPNKPLWISLIGPSGAGKHALRQKLLTTNQFYLIKTATNRKKRQEEKDSDYIWMRQQLPGEPEHSYLRNVIKEYNLFEYNYHYGNMYGAPYSSIKNALLSKKIVLYESDNQGARFMERLLSGIFNFVTISIIPDSIEDMEQRIKAGDRNNPTMRLTESLEKISNARKDSHFILKNPSKSVERGKSGLESATYALKALIFRYA